MIVKGTFKIFKIINHPNTMWEFIEQRRSHVVKGAKALAISENSQSFVCS